MFKWFKNLFKTKQSKLKKERQKDEAIAAEKVRIIEAREKQRQFDVKFQNFKDAWKIYEERIAKGWLNLKRPPTFLEIDVFTNVLPFQNLKEAADFFTQHLQEEVPAGEVQIGHFADPNLQEGECQELVYRYKDYVVVFNQDIVYAYAQLGQLGSNDIFVSAQSFKLVIKQPKWSQNVEANVEAKLSFSEKGGGLLCSGAKLTLIGQFSQWEKDFPFDYPKVVSGKLFFENLRQVFAENRY